MTSAREVMLALGLIYCPNCVYYDDDPITWCDCRLGQLHPEPPCPGVCKQKAHDPADCLWRPL